MYTHTDVYIYMYIYICIYTHTYIYVYDYMYVETLNPPFRLSLTVPKGPQHAAGLSLSGCLAAQRCSCAGGPAWRWTGFDPRNDGILGISMEEP